jgi:hypothetical protein
MALHKSDRLPVICKIHNKEHVRFEGHGSNHSFGCPDCVETIRAQVRAARKRLRTRTGDLKTDPKGPKGQS